MTATGKKPAAKATPSPSDVLGAVRAIGRSTADGYRYVRTREPRFIAGAVPVVAYTATAFAGPPFELATYTPGFIDPYSTAIDAWVYGSGAGDLAAPWPVAVAGLASWCALRYYRHSEHATRNREMEKIGRVLCSYEKIRGASLEAPRMKNFVRTPAGRRVDIEVPRQCDALVFEGHLPLLQNDLRAEVRLERIPAPQFGPLAWATNKLRPVTMKVSRGGARPHDDIAVVAQGGVRMTIVERDTLAAPLSSPWPALVPGPDGQIPARLWTDPLPVALDEDGEQVDLSFAKRPSILIAGESGSGKSAFTHEVIDAWILDPRSELMLWDGKGMLELNRYSCLTGGRIVGPDVEPGKVQLAALRAELTRREESLYARGLEEAAPDDPDCPPLLAVIEEFTAYLDKEFFDALVYLLVRVRVVNIRILLTIQRPSADTIPTKIRDNIAIRVCHSMQTDTGSDMALGPGWAKRGWNAQRIPLDDKGTYAGINFLLNEGAEPRRTRSWFVNPAMRATAVRRALELRGLPTEWADLRGAALAAAVGRPALARRTVAPQTLEPTYEDPEFLLPQIPARPQPAIPATGPAPATHTTPPVDPHAARRAHDATQFAGRRRRTRPGAAERRGLHAAPTPKD